jgi:hypothetical protein
MNIDYFEIRAYNRSGTKTAFISSTAEGHCLTGGQFTLNRNHGCGAFTFTLNRKEFTGTIDHGYKVEVWVNPGTGSDRYYTGIITSIPAAGTTAIQVRYEAQGLWYQVERQSISKFYEGAAINTIVTAILDDIDDDSDIDPSTGGISLASAYPLGDFEAEMMNAADALKLLAEVQGDVQYGVDQDGKLYFIDDSTTDVAHFWVGKHLEKFEPRELSDGVINRLYMQSRKLIGGGHLTLTRDQTTGDHSITNLGLRDSVAQIPHLSDPDDVWRWAEKQLGDSGIKTICEAKPVGFSEFVFPRGNARITDLDGTEYSLPIQAVTYRFDQAAGFIGEMQIGTEPVPELGEQIRRIVREVKLSKSNAVSLTKIEHTRGEEFHQDSIVDGQVNGFLNHWTFFGENLKPFDVEESYNMWHIKEHHSLGAPMDKTKARYQTVSGMIPTGQSVETVRLHCDSDFYGRISFEQEEDISDTWFENRTYWDTYDGKARARAIKSGSAHPTEFMYYNTLFLMPAYYKIRYGFTDVDTSTAYIFTFYYNYVDVNNWCRVEQYDTGSYSRFRWSKNVAGSITNIAQSDELRGADHEVEIYSIAPSSTAHVKIYRGGVLQTTLSNTNVPSPGGAVKWGPDAWVFGASPPGTPLALLDYLEWEGVAAGYDIQLSISRDGGTTWTNAALTHGEVHKDVSLSAQPSGSDLMIRADVDHPCRIYGLGLSF